jgi:hypothetical protein
MRRSISEVVYHRGVTARQIVEALRKAALAHPDVEEGVACAGTPLECATFKVRKKTFLFVNENNARVRLDKSRAAAAKLAKSNPECYVIGPQGWAKVMVAASPDVSLVEKWIGESYQLYAKKK